MDGIKLIGLLFWLIFFWLVTLSVINIATGNECEGKQNGSVDYGWKGYRPVNVSKGICKDYFGTNDITIMRACHEMERCIDGKFYNWGRFPYGKLFFAFVFFIFAISFLPISEIKVQPQKNRLKNNKKDSTEDIICKGITKKGNRCKKKAELYYLPDLCSGYCSLHKDQE